MVDLKELEAAIAEAEHKPGDWHVSATEFGAAAIRQPYAESLLGFHEEVIGRFPWKRDGWLAVAAVNALPSLIQRIRELERVEAAVANLVNDWRHLDGHAASPEEDAMRQDCADELANILTPPVTALNRGGG